MLCIFMLSPPRCFTLITHCFFYVTCSLSFFFFFNDTATTEIYTLSLHDALPILKIDKSFVSRMLQEPTDRRLVETIRSEEHTSELHHSQISYAVFCLKKKKKKKKTNSKKKKKKEK